MKAILGRSSAPGAVCSYALYLGLMGAAAMPLTAGAQEEGQEQPPTAESQVGAMSPIQIEDGFVFDPVAADLFADVPPPAPPELAATEEVENPYGMKAAWQQGDWVTRSTFVLLLLMSVSTWYILFLKLWEQRRMFAESRKASTDFWKSPSVADGLDKLTEGSAFWYVAERGLSASEHHEGTLVERIDLSEWITMSVNRAVNEVGARLQNGLAVLATVGSTAPFVGLFGTVWGIYHALTAIGLSGQASIDRVAGPVGEALIMTALGLAVAVPAVWAYNWLVRRNKVAMDGVRAFGSDLHSVLLSGTRVGKAGVPGPLPAGFGR